jgi:hypothetical protein
LGVADERTSHNPGDADVEVTIEVVRHGAGLAERVAGTFAGRPIRAAIVWGAVAAVLAVVAGVAVTIVTSSGSRPRTPTRFTAEVPPAPTVPVHGAAARFGIRSHCVRQAIVSPDGTFARVDYDQGVGCGTANNHVTLILRRVRGSWVPRFAAFLWRCPSNVLPRRVQTELHLCGSQASGRSWSP